MDLDTFCYLLPNFSNLTHLEVASHAESDEDFTDATKEVLRKLTSLKIGDIDSSDWSWRELIDQMTGLECIAIDSLKEMRRFLPQHGHALRGLTLTKELSFKDFTRLNRTNDLKLRQLTVRCLGANQLQEFLEKQKDLQILSMTLGSIDDDGRFLNFIGNTLIHLKQLRMVWDLDDELDISLIDVLGNLESLHLAATQASPQTDACSINHIAANIETCFPQLRALKVGYIGICYRCWFTIVTSCPNIKHLSVWGTTHQISEGIFQVIFDNLQLETLWVSSPRRGGRNSHSSCHLENQVNLKELTIYGGAIKVVPELPNLRALDVVAMQVPFLPETSPLLKKLKLKSCKLPSGVSAADIRDGLLELKYDDIT